MKTRISCSIVRAVGRQGGGLLLYVAIGWCGTSSRVTAQISEPAAPAQCTGKPRHLEKFRNGLQTGIQRADAIFNATDVRKDKAELRCKLDRVLDRLHEHVRTVLASDAADGRRCRVQGVADDFIFRLAQLLGQCVLDGAQWGQFTSNLYCELSIERGGLGEQGEFYRAPPGLCGALFENICDDVYAYVATEGTDAISARAQQFLSERALTITPYPGCAGIRASPTTWRSPKP